MTRNSSVFFFKKEIINNMTGGSITGNQSSGNSLGGGVYVDDGGTFKVSGKVNIQGNTAGEDYVTNVARASGGKINVIGPLDGSQIGVTTEVKTPADTLENIEYVDEDIFSTGYKDKVGTALPSKFFTADIEGYCVVPDASGEAKLLKHTHNIEYTAEGNVLAAKCEGCGQEYKITLNAEDGIYNEGLHPATLKIDDNFADFTGLSISEEDIEYYKGETQLDTAPIEHGTYTAKLTAKANNTDYTISKEYTIECAHDWDEPTYTRADNLSSVTATRVCKIDPTHKEEETVKTTQAVTKEATATEDGEKTYTATFENEAFKTQTKTEKIPVTGEEESVTYTFSQGADGKWTKGSTEAFNIVVNRSKDDNTTFSHFKSIEIDGKVLSAESYTAESGSLKAALKSDYLNTLAAGSHKLKIVFDDGSAETSFTVTEASSESSTQSQATESSTTSGTESSGTAKTDNRVTPKTGDESRTGILLLLAATSAVLAAVLYVLQRRRSKSSY